MSMQIVILYSIHTLTCQKCMHKNIYMQDNMSWQIVMMKNYTSRYAHGKLSCSVMMHLPLPKKIARIFVLTIFIAPPPIQIKSI